MSLKDRLKEYQQSQEAKNYFRSHNNYQLTRKDYGMALGAGLVLGIISGGLLAFIELHLSISFSIFYLAVGYLMAAALKRVTGKEGPHLGMTAAIMTFVAFYLKEVCSSLMMYATLGMNISIVKMLALGFGGLASSGLISWLFVLAGMYVAYNKSL